MTTSAPEAATSPPEPNPSQPAAQATPPPQAPAAAQPPAVEMDPVYKLIFRDLPKQKERIMSQEEVTAEQVHQELHGTVLALIGKLGAEFFHLRTWLAEIRQHDAAVIDHFSDRVEQLEGLLDGTSSQLIQEDAELFSRLAFALEGFVEQALQNPALPPDDKAKLDELTQMIALGKQRIEETVVADIEDDEPEEGLAAPTA